MALVTQLKKTLSQLHQIFFYLMESVIVKMVSKANFANIWTMIIVKIILATQELIAQVTMLHQVPSVVLVQKVTLAMEKPAKVIC